jgi:GTP-binding protein Era
MGAVLSSPRAGFVAILGKPNVGKSTLLNTLLGVKIAPITPKPQTTRRGVRGIFTDLDMSAQIVFVDTPGVHHGTNALDRFMKREIRTAIADVDAVLWVVDLRRPPSEEDKEVVRILSNIEAEAPVFLIGNKIDVAKYPDEALRLYRELFEPSHVYPMSALENPQAVYDLRTELLELLPESPFFFPEDISSDQTREAWAAELLRESTMLHLRQELPYSVATRVTDWAEPDNSEDPLYLSAEIWVERPGHRPIVIGKGGRMIREIGTTARKQLEIFLDNRIYLDLEVVVHKNWREDPRKLRELGYES